MRWERIRSKILALHRFDFQPKLKEAGLPAGLFILPRFALELMVEELSPVAFKVFQILLSKLDYELRTHWVSGISTVKLAELCQCRRGTIQKAIRELQKKSYIYVISGKKHQAKARGIRKHVYGQARKLGGNDYNAYSLLPFFVKLYMELDAQRLEEPESENLNLPPDEEVLKEVFGDQKLSKPLEDNEKIGKQPLSGDTPSLKPLGDNEENDTFDYIVKPLTNSHTFDNKVKPLTNRSTTNEIQTNELLSNDTHTNEGGAAAEKNRNSQGNPGPAPADGLGELALNLLRAYLSRNENVKSPIAVLKSLTEAQLETLACDALSWFLTYYFSDWELREEVERLMSEHGIKCVELLEYVQLSEEGKVEWLKKKGVLNDGND